MTKRGIWIKIMLVRAGVAELADAPALGAGALAWGFESLHPHQIKKSVLMRERIFLISSLCLVGIRPPQTKVWLRDTD